MIDFPKILHKNKKLSDSSMKNFKKLVPWRMELQAYAVQAFLRF